MTPVAGSIKVGELLSVDLSTGYFTVPGEGLYWGHVLIESAYYAIDVKVGHLSTKIITNSRL